MIKPADIQRVKELLPTNLGSAEIREKYSKEILQRSIFSARCVSARYLALIRDVCTRISEGTLDRTSARAELMAALEKMGHSPQDEGGLKNPASIRSINLILDTQTAMASSVAMLANQTESTLYAFPGWELMRIETRRAPREDWHQRWIQAGNSVGWKGAVKHRFIALKSSPIWQALGDGVGGFNDTLGNPYPPFAFQSGLDWVEVDREECDRLGILKDEQPFSAASLAPTQSNIADAIERYGFDDIAEGLI